VTDIGHAHVYRGNLDRLIEKILDERGMDLSQYRRTYLERRIAARLRSLDVHTYRQYSDRLDADPEEYAHLIDTLTINVTEFFRDKPVWDILRRRVIPDLVADKRQGRSRAIRVWSAGCATGEEPYSIAMCLLDALGEDASKFLVTVTGTDLDSEALATAGRGIYEVDKARRIPPSYQVRFIKMRGARQFEIAPEVRRLVRFAPYSLFDDAPMRVVDIVMCRNVFIYFDRGRQGLVLENFLKAMGRGAYLVLGRSEKLTVEAGRLLTPVEARERIYRKPLRS
jgi:chemotaxis methyl-accepting protein methylase